MEKSQNKVWIEFVEHLLSKVNLKKFIGIDRNCNRSNYAKNSGGWRIGGREGAKAVLRLVYSRAIKNVVPGKWAKNKIQLKHVYTKADQPL